VSKIVLNHGDTPTLDAMFSFLNTGDYDYKGTIPCDGDPEPRTRIKQYLAEEGIDALAKTTEVHRSFFHVDVYRAAGRYFPVGENQCR
jgi:hypothetical protein